MILLLAIVGGIVLVAGGIATRTVRRMMGEVEALLTEDRLGGSSAV